MFWIFISVLSFAFMFTKLGALSVLASVLSSALSLAAIVIACLIITLLWRKLSKTKQLKSDGS